MDFTMFIFYLSAVYTEGKKNLVDELRIDAPEDKELLMNITPEKVEKIYNGQANKCYCGCSGDYKYTRLSQVEGGKNRGYPVEEDEVSDKTVRMRLRKMKRLVSSGLGRLEVYPSHAGRIYTVAFGNDRVLTVYLSRVKKDDTV